MKQRLGKLGVAAVLLAAVGGCYVPPTEDAPAVILVHGLGRGATSMSWMASRLNEAGFRAVTFDYPSTSEPMEVLVDSLGALVANCCAGEEQTVHFVTHSMGGVLVRTYLTERSPGHEGRVVMLSPPSQGSEIIDAFADTPLLRATLGPSAVRLGTDSTGFASHFGPLDFRLGIIAGNLSLNPLGSWLIPGPDDGKVGVDRTRIEGAADFLVMSATHTFIMNDPEVAEEVVHFLRDGQFRNHD